MTNLYGKRLGRIKTVAAICDVCPTTIRRWEADPDLAFPRAVVLSRTRDGRPTILVWDLGEVHEWISDRIGNTW